MDKYASKAPAQQRLAAKPAHVAPPGFTRDVLEQALADAELWAEGGYSANSRTYWTGVRDTLRVLLGVTTGAPGVSTDDAAAMTLFSCRAEAKKG